MDADPLTSMIGAGLGTTSSSSSLNATTREFNVTSALASLANKPTAFSNNRRQIVLEEWRKQRKPNTSSSSSSLSSSSAATLNGAERPMFKFVNLHSHSHSVPMPQAAPFNSQARSQDTSLCMRCACYLCTIINSYVCLGVL